MKRERANQELRERIKQAGLHYWEVAAVIGINDCTFTKWLRMELAPEKRDQVLKAIAKLESRNMQVLGGKP